MLKFFLKHPQVCNGSLGKLVSIRRENQNKNTTFVDFLAMDNCYWTVIKLNWKITCGHVFFLYLTCIVLIQFVFCFCERNSSFPYVFYC